MCISVLSTSHPDYPFILISNRDEFIARPTLRANWWDAPNQHVLGGRDLQRSDTKGTWLAMTKQGRIAILTNFREEGDTAVNMTKSRGAMVNAYLCVPPASEESEEAFVQRLMQQVGFEDIGGFSMLFGYLRKPKSSSRQNGEHRSLHTPGLALVSNRTENPKKLNRIATSLAETHGVSNSHFGDRTWPKVVHGEEYLQQAIANNQNSTQQQLIDSLFGILCEDALPTRRNSEDWDMYVRHMRESIMIPPAKGEATRKHSADELRTADATSNPGKALLKVGKGAYGTSKQTVILVDWKGRVTFIERTLYDEEGLPVEDAERDVRYEFDIEGWEEQGSAEYRL